MSAVEEIVDALQAAIAQLNRASLAANRAKLKNLHVQIESAWSETDHALANARSIESEVAS